MRGFSLCPGRMLWVWMRHFCMEMLLVLGWFGPLLLRGLLRMLFGLLGGLSLLEVLSLVAVCFVCVLFGLEALCQKKCCC